VVQFRSSKFRSHSEVLLDKVAAVQRDPVAALGSVGICHTPGGWQVSGVFVTGHVEIAAFAAQPKYPFVSIERFRQFLATPRPPAPGWWEPAEERSVAGSPGAP